MNKQFILSNLIEAKEELEKTIQAIQSEEDYGFGDFHLSMAHAYHHMNSAWNGREISDTDWREYSDETYTRLEKFPIDLPMIGQDHHYDLHEYKETEQGGSPKSLPPSAPEAGWPRT